MISEDVLADDDLRRFAERDLSSFHFALTARLSEEIDAGALRAELDAAATASVITTYAQGLWRMAMVEFDRPDFERQIELFLSGPGSRCLIPGFDWASSTHEWNDALWAT